MCEQCLVNPLYFGEVLPGWYLIRARRDGNDPATEEDSFPEIDVHRAHDYTIWKD